MKKSFIEYLIDKIVSNRHMPKAQLERQISPVLEIFIESIFNKLAQVEHKSIGKGEYKLIGSEFPLNTISNDLRSFNIDYLLFNKDEKALYFVELKTDTGSFNLAQHDKYMNIIKEKNPSELYNFLDALKNNKYKEYKKLIDENIPKGTFEDTNLIKLVYIAPSKLKKPNRHMNEKTNILINEINFITFEDLSKYTEIEHDFCDEWKVISQKLKELDKN